MEFPEPYMSLFNASSKALKAVHPSLRVGGPATMQLLNVADFIEAANKMQIDFDFVSTHMYPTDPQCTRPSKPGEAPPGWRPDCFTDHVKNASKIAKAAGKPEGRDAIYAHFVSLVRDNLHIVLSMSPVGDAFRVRCRMFPSLVNCCTIDWYDEWPQDALLSVAERYFEPVDLGSLPTTTQQEFVIAAPNLPPGAYLVSWRAVGADTHVVSGEFQFEVAELVSRD